MCPPYFLLPAQHHRLYTSPSPTYSTTASIPPTHRRTETALQPALPPPQSSSPPAPAAPKSKITPDHKYCGGSGTWPRQAVSNPHTKTCNPQRLSAASARVLLGKCLLVIQRCFSIGEEEARRMRTCETACGSVRAGAVSRLKGICKSPFWGGRRKSKLFTGEGPLFVCVRFRVRVRIVYHSRSRRGDGVELVD